MASQVDVAEPNWSDFGPPKDPVYYQRLGVNAYVTMHKIKIAYRKLAKTLHPDTGGSPEAFHELGEAYAILSDIRLRVEYHVNGVMDQSKTRSSQDVEVKGAQCLYRACAEVIQASQMADAMTGARTMSDFSNKDFIGAVRTNIASGIAQKRDEIKMVEDAKKAMVSLASRLSFNPGEDVDANDIIGSYFKGEMMKMDSFLTNSRRDLEEFEAGQALLAYYSFQWSNPPKPPNGPYRRRQGSRNGFEDIIMDDFRDFEGPFTFKI